MLTLMQQVVKLVQEAGQASLPYWKNQQTQITHKADDSPVTEADLAVNQLLLRGLTELTPDIPILSEEACNIPLSIRKTWHQWWLIDPLDGTKEFIEGREDFTVNVALIEQGHVVFGVVGIPVTEQCFYGGKHLGAWQLQNNHHSQTIHCRSISAQPISVVASHRHTSKKQESFIKALQTIQAISLKSIGSSLKFCLLATGEADCYPRFAPTCQWDTGAAQGVLEGAGGVVITEQGVPLEYQPKADYLNPYFIALGDTNYLQTIVKLL